MTASGSKTAIYIVQEEGDPNEGFDPDKEEGDVQYLIKWKNWSYIHNTWDSEKNLMEQRVNGLKKLDNFKKFRNELEAWYVSAFCNMNDLFFTSFKQNYIM